MKTNLTLALVIVFLTDGIAQTVLSTDKQYQVINHYHISKLVTMEAGSNYIAAPDNGQSFNAKMYELLLSIKTNSDAQKKSIDSLITITKKISSKETNILSAVNKIQKILDNYKDTILDDSVRINYNSLFSETATLSNYATIAKLGDNFYVTSIRNNNDLVFTSEFNNGSLIPRKPFNTWGYIDRSGKFRIPCQFDFASEFSGNYAIVKGSDEKWYIIDTLGQKRVELTPPEIKKNDRISPLRYEKGSAMINGFFFINCPI